MGRKGAYVKRESSHSDEAGLLSSDAAFCPICGNSFDNSPNGHQCSVVVPGRRNDAFCEKCGARHDACSCVHKQGSLQKTRANARPLLEVNTPIARKNEQLLRSDDDDNVVGMMRSNNNNNKNSDEVESEDDALERIIGAETIEMHSPKVNYNADAHFESGPQHRALPGISSLRKPSAMGSPKFGGAGFLDSGFADDSSKQGGGMPLRSPLSGLRKPSSMHRPRFDPGDTDLLLLNDPEISVPGTREQQQQRPQNDNANFGFDGTPLSPSKPALVRAVPDIAGFDKVRDGQRPSKREMARSSKQGRENSSNNSNQTHADQIAIDIRGSSASNYYGNSGGAGSMWSPRDDATGSSSSSHFFGESSDDLYGREKTSRTRKGGYQALQTGRALEAMGIAPRGRQRVATNEPVKPRHNPRKLKRTRERHRRRTERRLRREYNQESTSTTHASQETQSFYSSAELSVSELEEDETAILFTDRSYAVRLWNRLGCTSVKCAGGSAFALLILGMLATLIYIGFRWLF